MHEYTKIQRRYINMAESIKNQFKSIEEAKQHPIDPELGYFPFAIQVPGEFRRYRLSKDRAGNVVVNEDNALSIYDIVETRRRIVIELGEEVLRNKINPICIPCEQLNQNFK